MNDAFYSSNANVWIDIIFWWLIFFLISFSVFWFWIFLPSEWKQNSRTNPFPWSADAGMIISLYKTNLKNLLIKFFNLISTRTSIKENSSYTFGFRIYKTYDRFTFLARFFYVKKIGKKRMDGQSIKINEE